MRSPATFVVTTAAVLLVAACSSGSGGATAPTAAPEPSGPCDTAALAEHAGVAAGAVAAYVWKPYKAGEFDKTAAGRKAALARASAAAARAEKELGAVGAVDGCRTSVSMSSALTTGASLARSVSRQMAKGTVNAAALGGLNSAVTTVVQQARVAGATVTVKAPPKSELAAG